METSCKCSIYNLVMFWILGCVIATSRQNTRNVIEPQSGNRQISCSSGDCPPVSLTSLCPWDYNGTMDYSIDGGLIPNARCLYSNPVFCGDTCNLRCEQVYRMIAGQRVSVACVAVRPCICTSTGMALG